MAARLSITFALFALVACFALGIACGARTELRGTLVDRDATIDALDGEEASAEASHPSPCKVTEPTLLASGGKEIQFITLDDTAVYWSDFALGTINAVPKAGGASQVIASGRGSPSGLVVVANDVYWAEFAGDAVAHAAASGGGGITHVATGQDGAYEITSAGADVYWTTLRVCSVARSESAGQYHVIEKTKQPFTAIASTNDLVFWVSFQRKAVERYDIASSVISVLFGADEVDLPASLATDGKNVYYGSASSSEIDIGAISTDGGEAHSLYASKCTVDTDASAGPCTGDLATDGDFVYFTAAADDDADAGAGGVVRKVPVGGGAPITVASGQAHPFSVAVDDACIYWSNLGDGTVWAAPRK